MTTIKDHGDYSDADQFLQAARGMAMTKMKTEESNSVPPRGVFGTIPPNLVLGLGGGNPVGQSLWRPFLGFRA